MIPLVSVIITTYARPENLLRAIESVQNQTYKNVEIIVVDDNGKDTPYQKETAELLHPLIEQHAITYLVHEVNKNGSAARNTGFKHANGQYINFVDDDDVLRPGKIETQVAKLEGCPAQYGAVYCSINIIGQKKQIKLENRLEGNLTEQLLSGEVRFNTTSILFRRLAIEVLKGWDESFYRHQDWELMVRFFRLYNVGCCPVILMDKYSTPNVISRNPLKAVEYNNKFLSTFADDIQKTSNPKKIFQHHKQNLALVCLKAGLKEEGLKLAKEGYKYGAPSLYILFKYVYWLVKGKKR